ncbi:MAG TPA: hypothetical protein VKF36_18740 [Syntrophorhabdales bacterium]|nr:hypothetical protein [Syntrophorhabdales bacterium]
MKRRLLLRVLAVPAFLLLFGAVIWLSLQSAFIVNRAATLAAPILGYRVRVEAISFSPDLHARITGLAITPLNDKGPSISCVHAEVKGTLRNVISAEVEKLVLTGPKFFFRLGATGNKSDLSALQNLPPVRLLLIEQGEADISYATTHVKLTNLRADVKNFSPQTGGSARFAAVVEVSSQGDQGPVGHGRCEGKVDATGPLNKPKAKGSVSLSVESASIGTTSVQNLSLSSVFDLDATRIVLEPATFNVGSLVMKGQGRTVNVEGYTLAARVSYELESTGIALDSVRGNVPGVGPFTAAFQGALKSDAPWKASLEAPSVNFTQFFSSVKPFLPEEYRAWSIQGAGALEMTGEGPFDGGWKADVKLTFREGGFKSGDESKAGQKITGSVILKLRSGPEGKKTRFDLALDASDGELLWGNYYKNFKDQQVRVASQGNYSPDEASYLDGSGTLDLFGTGQYSFSGTIGTDESVLKASGKNLAHNRLFSILLRDYLHVTYPLASSLEITGKTDFDIQARVKEGRTFLEGRLQVYETVLNLPGLFSVNGMTLSLPFDLVYPSAPAGAESREGGEAQLIIRKLQRGSILVEDLTIPFIVSRNSLRLLKAIDLKLYGGEFHLSRLEGQDLLSADRIFNLALSLNHIDLALLTEDVLGDRVTGTINADLPGVVFQSGGWRSTKGQLQAGIFGGVVEVHRLFGHDLFSESRKIGCDIFFRDIDLERVTRKITLGKMTGILKGSVANLVIEYGQPARFFLDVESDPTKKVSQTISVTAVENLSILGTGSSAVSSVLNSGFHKFFKEYPYSRIGILCTLENDTFSIRGKIHEEGKEYLVRRGWLRGIDVIIQNPDNSISFGDMEERIGRIFRAKKDSKKVS